MKKIIVSCLLMIIGLNTLAVSTTNTTHAQLPTIQFLDRNGRELGIEAPHAEDYALQMFRDLLIDQFERQGALPESIPQQVNDLINSSAWVIYTSLDLEMQTIAQQAVMTHLPTLSQFGAENAAVVVLDPASGEIRAMIGNVDYNNQDIDGSINIAAMHRAPATVLMPFVYASAMEHGWEAASVVWDTRTIIDTSDGTTYQPVNYDNRFRGPLQVRDALANSYNVPATQVLQSIGVDQLVNLLRRVGLSSVDPDDSIYDMSLAVGQGVSLTLVELTSAYGTLANYGQLIEPHMIRCVLNRVSSEILYEYNGGCLAGNRNETMISDSIFTTTVLDPRIAFLISDIMADNVARSPAFGSNSVLNTSYGAAVKTGLSGEFTDNWTIGYTPSLAVGVWAGNSNNTPMQNVSSLSVAAPIWHDTIEGITTGLGWSNQSFAPPNGISLQQVCVISSLRDPAVACPQFRSEWVLNGPILVPDGNGQLVYIIQESEEPSSEEVRYRLEMISPGVVQTDVRPLTEDEIAVYLTNFPDSMPPHYCLVPLDAVSSTPGSQLQLFIEPPLDTSNSVFAYEFALTNGIAILPADSCESAVFTTSGT